MNTEKFGKKLKPPVSARRVRAMCENDQIPGAKRVGEGNRATWDIPKNTKDPRLPPGRPPSSAPCRFPD